MFFFVTIFEIIMLPGFKIARSKVESSIIVTLISSIRTFAHLDELALKVYGLVKSYCCKNTLKFMLEYHRIISLGVADRGLPL